MHNSPCAFDKRKTCAALKLYKINSTRSPFALNTSNTTARAYNDDLTKLKGEMQFLGHVASPTCTNAAYDVMAPLGLFPSFLGGIFWSNGDIQRQQKITLQRNMKPLHNDDAHDVILCSAHLLVGRGRPGPEVQINCAKCNIKEF